MSELKVKICGLRELEHARAAVDAGADWLGFVFAPTRRYVAPETVTAIARHLPRSVKLVGLFVDEQPERIRAIAAQCHLDYVQLCGDETPEDCRALGIPLVKSLHVRGPEVVHEMERYADVADWCVLDSYQPNARGGTGTSFDWRVAEGLSARHRFVLAGGLTPENVSDAIAKVRPYGVDVSSGVETGGRKDVGKIVAFVEAARLAACRLSQIGSGRGASE